MRIVLMLAFLMVSQAATSPPTWHSSPLFKSTIFTVIASNKVMVTSPTATLPFGVTYTAAPRLLIAIFRMTAIPGDVLDFYVKTANLTMTTIDITYTIGATTVSQLSIYSLTFETSTFTAFLNVEHNQVFPTSSYGTVSSVTSTGARSASDNVNLTAATGVSMVTNHAVRIGVFVQGIAMQCNLGNFDLSVSAVLVTSEIYKVTVSTSGNSTITSFAYSLFIYDETSVQASQITFVDSGVLTATASAWNQLGLSLVWMTSTNFLAGLTSIAYQSTANVDFYFTVSTMSCFGYSTFDSLSIGYWSFRNRTCPDAYPLFTVETNLCYDICPGYFYENTTTQLCFPCSYPCLTCSNTTLNTNCTSCQPNDHRVQSGTDCLCAAGYFDNGVSLCLICSSKCLTCSSFSVCTSCEPSNKRTLAGGQCLCDAGYVDNAVPLCAPCSSLLLGCSSCSNSSVCTNCDTSLFFTLSNQACACQIGYFLSGSTCNSCSVIAGCKACTSMTACTSCDSSTNFLISGSTCACSSGFTLNSGSCASCSSLMAGCLTCSSTTTCLSCDTNSGFKLSSGSCSCMSGTYLNGGICSLCHNALSNCLTCSSGTICTKCNVPFILSSGSCVCATKYYASSSNTCSSCSVPMPGCIGCTSSTICQTCATSLNFVVSGSACACTTGYYLLSRQCIKCMYGCLACTSASVCTNCDATNNFVVSSGLCVCEPGYTLIGGICELCSTFINGCNTCSSSSFCTGCLSGYGLILETNGTCSCSSGFAWDLDLSACVSSPSLCQTGSFSNGSSVSCSTCTTQFAGCSSCTSTTCFSCAKRYYVDSTSCTLCSIPLVGCILCNNAAFCTLCDFDANFLLSGSTCICQPGNALNSTNSCVACSTTLVGCLSCTTLSDCIDCNLASDFVTDPTNSSRCACSVGFYLEVDSCLDCRVMTGCLACTSGTVCTICDQIQSYELKGTSCGCMANAYLSGTTCVVCNTAFPGCYNCTDNSACLSCDTVNHFVSNGADCICAPGYYLSSGACIPCDISCSVCDATTGATCSVCNTAAGFTVGTGAATCSCTTGLYLPSGGVSCATCSTAFPMCLDCDSLGCKNCQSPSFVAGSICACPFGSFNNNTDCQVCSTKLNGCISCTISTCLSCNTSMRFISAPVSGICTCQSGTVMVGTNCTYCSSLITGCNFCSSPAVCTVCSSTNNFQLSSTNCVCMPGYFLDPATKVCVACSTTLPGCIQCSDSLTCTACVTSTQITLQANHTCQCAPLYALINNDCVSCFIDCICYGYQWNSSSMCVPFCSDGITIVPTEACDDGNIISGDGCSTACVIEPHFNCTIDPVTLLTTCTAIPPIIITITLVSTIKNPGSNTVVFTFDISPALPSFTSLDFAKSITSNLYDTSQLDFLYNGNGVLELTAHYNTSLQYQSIALKFDPAAINNAFSEVVSSDLTFVVDPDNNIPAILYDSGTYNGANIMKIVGEVVAYGSLGLFVAALFLAKFIGIEMIGVMQVAFLGLMIVTNLPPLIAPLNILVRSTGYNEAFSNSTQLQSGTVPYRISSLSLRAPMIYSLNYTLILLILPFVVALCLFIASKIKKGNQAQQEKLVRWSMIALNEWGFTAVLFVLYHTTASLVLFVLSAGQLDQTMMAISAVEIVMVLSLTIASLVLFKYKAEYVGEYRQAFNPDVLSQFHYWLVAGTRILLAALLVGVNSMDFSGFICLSIPLVSIIYLAAKRPYNFLYNNIRAIVNEVIILAVLGIYASYRALFDYTNQTTLTVWVLPVIEVALLLICMIMNAIFMVKYWFDSRTRSKEQAKLKQLEEAAKIEQRQQAEFLEQTKARLAFMLDPQNTSQRFSPLDYNNTSTMKILATPLASNPPGSKDTKMEVDDIPNFNLIVMEKSPVREKLLAKKMTKKNILTKTSITQEEAFQVNKEFDQL